MGFITQTGDAPLFDAYYKDKQEVTYNPYKNETFVCKDRKVISAAMCCLVKRGGMKVFASNILTEQTSSVTIETVQVHMLWVWYVPDRFFQEPAKPDNKGKNHVDSRSDPRSVHESSFRRQQHCRVKLATLNQSLTSIRKNLRDAGIAEEEIKEIFPPLIRRTGPRSSGRSVAIAKMVAEAKAAAEAKALAKLETATAPEWCSQL